ncbi:MAG TPA: SDR family NAD(P)-dependent oxidoreductase, partial [Nitrospiria bacterium]|nr:SDR family NAD(P)-dependent oxidoreductase [Nitrospiria bacterium]
MRLENKTVLITGAGSGIGRETALLFSSEGAGIVAVDVDDAGGKETVKMIEAQGARAVYVHADVAKGSDCEMMVAAAEKNFGKLNVLFNNAGIMDGRDDDAVKTEEDVWERTISVNLKGVFL